MKYKLIVSDFDNTLADHNRKVSEYTLNAIREYEKAGGRFMICTGRMFSSARAEALALGLKGDCIAYNGALVGDIETGEVKYSAFIKKDVAINLIRHFEKIDDVCIQLYFDDKIYVQQDNPYTSAYVKECNGIPFYVTGEPLSVFIEKQDRDVTEVLVMASAERVLELYNEYRAKKSDDYTVISSEVHFLEFISPEANKGIAVRKMCEAEGIDSEEIVCVGDNYNDIFMVEYAGLGVAVSNAVDELKQKADYITDSNEDNGVAKLVEKIIKGEI